MHELSITQEVVRTVEDARRGAGLDLRVTAVRLKIGRLTAVVPDCLKFYFEMLTKDTPLEGAAVNIEIVPMNARCGACGAQFSLDEPMFLCPECGSGETEILSGRELVVDSIEVDEM